ncbi:hypothetical protein [Glycomyces sp. NRRL B-16210]|uniref:hypothetical protein n=1 Tax=Glycomyces sp. NRRL B-16210 TaxID=1463821 RepID=UPI0005502388|nr:hypothetical protein [Glycomyces sp. NRRL B-16210]
MTETQREPGDERTREARTARSGGLGALDPVAAYERRTARIREEIARNRRGEYTVPTWVLALALAAVVGVWVLILFVL